MIKFTFTAQGIQARNNGKYATLKYAELEGKSVFAVLKMLRKALNDT